MLADFSEPGSRNGIETDHLSLTGFHRFDNKAIGRPGSTGKLRRIHAEQALEEEPFGSLLRPGDSTKHFRSHTPTGLAR